MQGKAFLIEVRRQLTVAHGCVNGYGAGVRVQPDYLLHRGQRNKVMSTVGNVVEAVARAQHFQVLVFANQFLHLCNGFSGVEPLRKLPAKLK